VSGFRLSAFGFRLAIAICTLVASAARADTLGLYAPSAPFPSTAARVELAQRLGKYLGDSVNIGLSAQVFARAGDFAAAVKKGEVTIALVDASYLAAAGGNYTVIAAAVRGGETNHAWQLVARGASTIAQLKGKRVLVPAVGGREVDFALAVMLGGEVARDYFAAIEGAPDTASALAALGLGKADAAIVPGGVELPAGTQRVLALPAIAGPLLVVYGSATPRAAVASAAASFQGDATVAGFRAGDGDVVRSIARRFTVAVKRGPFAVPAIRVLVGDLVEGRTFAIERTPASTFVVRPERR